MADVPVFSPNPFANFDPSQWSNPYSKFYGKSLPFPSSYVGAPTDAMGNPIQPPPGQAAPAPAPAPAPAAAPPAAPMGTTLNSSPAATPTGYGPLDALVQGVQQAQAGKQSTPYGLAGTNPYATAAAGGATPQQLAGMFSQMSPTLPTSQDSGLRGGTGGAAPAGVVNPNYANRIGQLMAGIGPGQQQAAPAPAAAPQPSNLMDLNSALSLLANPGKVTTPGATVAQSAPPQSGSNVLQQFLAGFKPAQSGPGSGFQQSFAKALKGS